MTELTFKGKEFVYNHHLAVPFRPLVPDEAKGIGPVNLSGNLIVQGDNLHALKALLPMYAGKVDCIYIDPPYNTGKDGWCYKDDLSAPMIKDWLDKEVGLGDGLRHDKWCCMMWPRLKLLHELCSDEGVIFISIDDNEIHNLRILMDEIFGDRNFLGQITVEVNPKGRGLKDSDFAKTHEYLVVYQADKRNWLVGSTRDEEKEKKDFPLEDKDGRYRELELRNTHREFGRHNRENLWYPLYGNADGSVTVDKCPDGIEMYPIWPDGYEGCWTWDRKAAQSNKQLLTWHNVGERKVVYRKGYSRNITGQVIRQKLKTIWKDSRFHTEKGNAEINSLKLQFDNPKPVALIEEILSSFPKDHLTLLDSFAGSGTTGHAALSINHNQNRNWRFILIEGENYADHITAQRLRCAIQKYDESDGLQLQKSNSGTFTYCTLGAPVEMDKILTGETLPDFAGLGAALFHMATNRAFDPAAADEATGYLGETEGQHVWLIYRPDLDWLKSSEAALTLARAQQIAASKADGKKHLVFAPARYVSQKLLAEQNIPVEFVPLPFALYRMERT